MKEVDRPISGGTILVMDDINKKDALTMVEETASKIKTMLGIN